MRCMITHKVPKTVFIVIQLILFLHIDNLFSYLRYHVAKHLYIKNCPPRMAVLILSSADEVDAAFCFSCGHSIEYHSISNNSRGECSFEECDCRNYLDQEIIPQLEDIDHP